MPSYLMQVAYSAEGLAAIIKNPEDRTEAVRKPIEKLGGKLQSAWFTFGEYDVAVILDMPDNVSAAAIALAFGGGGACKSVKTTPLLSPAEALEALKKAGGAGYKPATAKK
ncbi:MAG TPA: GYD domain-containing protein [Terracidiphilus sp.]|nr:GYD domain-containing protein [Terracidiphilus sp.]